MLVSATSGDSNIVTGVHVHACDMHGACGYDGDIIIVCMYIDRSFRQEKKITTTFIIGKVFIS